MIEAFWSRMQVELLDRKKWNTRLALANAIFEYLEVWHNRKTSSRPARVAHADTVRAQPDHHRGMRIQGISTTRKQGHTTYWFESSGCCWGWW